MAAGVPELRGMNVGGPSPAEPDGPDGITFEIETIEANDARLLAHHLVLLVGLALRG